MKALRMYLLPATLFCAALALPSRSAAAPGQTFHSNFRGLTADADFFSFDSSGCVQTSAFVTATNGRIAMLGRPETSSSVSVSLSQFDVCTFTDLLEAFGSATPPEGAFLINKKLTSATLNTSVEVFDFISSATFTVDISLSWSGSGALSTSKDHVLLRQPGLTVNFKTSSTSRQATASGSMTGNGTNFSPFPSSFADLMDVKQGVLEVFH